MVKTLMRTSDDVVPAIARVTLGLVMLPHGLQKTLGWFGGYGFEGSLGYLTGLGIPGVLAVAAIVAETAGAIALIVGAFGRLAALAIGVELIVAALMVHRTFFFMNWGGSQGGEGYEFHLLAVALAAIVLIRGSGKLSVDRLIAA